jgi:hypothetical protein
MGAAGFSFEQRNFLPSRQQNFHGRVYVGMIRYFSQRQEDNLL